MEEIIHPKGKIYYSMGEVCEIFGVNASLLRFWEEEFPILKISKNSRGHRIYTPEDVDNIRLIYHLVKEQGMTLDGAKKRIRQNREGIRRDAEVMDRLRNIRNLLLELKEELGDNTEVIDIDDEEPQVEEPQVAEPQAAKEAAAVPQPQPESEQEQEPEQEPEPEPEPEAEPEPEPQPMPAQQPASNPFVAPSPASETAGEKRKPQVVEQTLF